jgi:hypothetical protein
VLWRPGFTVWTVIWNNDNCESISQRLAALKLDASPQAFDALEESDEQIVRYCYRLAEDADDERQPALNSFALDDDGHVQMSIYFDDPNDLVDALSIWRSLKSSSSD